MKHINNLLSTILVVFMLIGICSVVQFSASDDSEETVDKSVTEAFEGENTVTFYFYAPEEYNGKVGVRYGKKDYISTQTETADNNIYVMKSEAERQIKIFNLNTDTYDSLYTECFIPDKKKSVIYFIAPGTDSELEPAKTVVPFYYYGDGKYGIYETLEEAKEKDAIHSGGEYPDELYAVELNKGHKTIKPVTAFEDSEKAKRPSTPDIKDIVPENADTVTMYFYAPETFRKRVGVYWFEGDYNCTLKENLVSNRTSGWPGYIVSQTEEADNNIFVLKIPKNAYGLMFNNLVNDFYAQEVTSGFTYPVNNTILVIDPARNYNFDGYNEINGDLYHYYGNGKYGIYPTLEEAEANNTVHSGGEIPNEPYEIDNDGVAYPKQQPTEPAETQLVTEKPTEEAIFPSTSIIQKPVVKPKKANPVKVSVSTKTVKLKKLKKKAQKVKALTVKNAQGKVTYKIKSVPKKLKKFTKISSKGIITIKKWKKAVKGTYIIKVTIKAAGNASYKSKTVTKNVKIKIK